MNNKISEVYNVYGNLQSKYPGEYEDAQEYSDTVDTYKEGEGFDSYEPYFMTEDGKVFIYKENAEAHSKTFVIPELNEVQELLSKALLLAEANKDKSQSLQNVVVVLKQLDRDGGSDLVTKWYDSTCY